MHMIRKIILGASSTLLLAGAFSGTAMANNGTMSSPAKDITQRLAQSAPKAVIRHKNIAMTAPQYKTRIVRKTLTSQNKAIRTMTQGRFVLGADQSRDVMTVYKTVKYSKAMPNKFKP